MHDWTLMEILVDWAAARVEINFLDNKSTRQKIIADGVIELNVPRHCEWGESLSVNEVKGPQIREIGFFILIEMQSGDGIELLAKSIVLPPVLVGIT